MTSGMMTQVRNARPEVEIACAPSPSPPTSTKGANPTPRATRPAAPGRGRAPSTRAPPSAPARSRSTRAPTPGPRAWPPTAPPQAPAERTRAAACDEPSRPGLTAGADEAPAPPRPHECAQHRIGDDRLADGQHPVDERETVHDPLLT